MSEQGLNVIRCISTAEILLPSILSYIGSETEIRGRAGGYLCVADKTGHPLCIAQIGDVPEEKRQQYFRNAIEKANRLGVLSLWVDHRFSRQSRNEQRERWGGAVRGRHFIWSFSGLPEDGDEMFMAILGARYDDLTLIDIMTAELTGNIYFEKLKRLFPVVAF